MTEASKRHWNWCCRNASIDKVVTVLSGPSDKEPVKVTGGSSGPESGPPSGRHKMPTFSSTELFAGGSEIRIMHEQALYRLKITRQGKLILNK